MTAKTVYKSGYLPIQLEGCSKEQLIDINNQLFNRLKELRKNYIPGDYEITLITDILKGKEPKKNSFFYSLTCVRDNSLLDPPISELKIKLNSVAIFPYSWVIRGHKARNDKDPEIKRLKKHLFRIYKHNLHKRSKFHKLRKGQ
ncbi:hypothetical protein KPN8_242 [Klebsiella phage KPN8]|nr:hypothetical protein KPN8_242 [Klebsiella phage KPN8]